MQTTATAKYSEALASEIADALNAAPHAAGRVTIYYDTAADTHGVQIRVGRTRYELLIPAPGSMYALFRNGSWCGGMNLATTAQPVDVALAMLDRIAATTR
jgi:hypothetical protein